jgi:hypothetical protein
VFERCVPGRVSTFVWVHVNVILCDHVRISISMIIVSISHFLTICAVFQTGLLGSL